MLWANDKNDDRVHILDTHSNQEYYCPTCGATLITRKGDVRQHHFAHKRGLLCSDTWERTNSHNYDTSPWHNQWQSKFPKENQEVILALGDTKHRADVMIDRTVIEFQHSIISTQAFDDRNNFYLNLGDKVVWLFDVSELVKSGKLRYLQEENELRFTWDNPKKTFNKYDIHGGCIDLFFQLNEREENSIVKVVRVSAFGFVLFYTTKRMSKTAFLNYVGLKKGSCLPPCDDDLEKNEQYQAFKEKYNIVLNKQQERAMLAVEGANLLLAVPGSGKTTVLVNRLGHMVLNKNIPPENILAISFTNAAAQEMQNRFSSIFGKETGSKISFMTINSLSKRIYEHFCNDRGKKIRDIIIDGSEKKYLLRKFYKNYNKETPCEGDLLNLSNDITYIKNQQLDEKQIRDLEFLCPNLYEIYCEYEDHLKNGENKKIMDIDNQLVFAHWILENKNDVANYYRAKYKYICVDEAQDTSKIQHEIIKILAEGNNLFMVGDEDQSIYGFRAAYPKALLNFRYDYLNPYILRMEKNYRSVPEIVDESQKFISKNKGRYNKNMSAERSEHGSVIYEDVETREEQFYRLLEIARNATSEVAFLYRDNESAVVLVDLLLRNNIPFSLRKPEMNYLKGRVVFNLKEYFNAALSNGCQKPLNELFDDFVNEKNLHPQRVEVLRILSHLETDVKKFLIRLEELEKRLSENQESNCNVVLSTIHSSKGAEYDSVYMVDVYDGRFPSSKPNRYSRSKDAAEEARSEQEERRLFYVGMTRAKNNLTFFNIKDRYSQYIEEIFPEVKQKRLEEESRKAAEEKERRLAEEARLREEQAKKEQERRELEKKERAKREQERRERAEKELEQRIKAQKENERIKAEQAKRFAEEDYNSRYKEVKDKFTQQDTPIYDSSGKRWVQCEICGKIKPFTEFWSCGGKNHTNLGKCNACKK